MLKVKIENTDKFDIEAYQYNAEIMGEVNLSCDVYLNVALDYFDLDMYVNINGENLYLSSFEPTGVKNTDNIYPKYSLVFESKRVQLKRKYFRDLTSETGIDWGTEYSFYGNIADFTTRFQKNLTKYFLNNEWSIEVYGNHSQDVSVLFEASNLYLFDALKQMSEIWDKEWKIVSSGETNVIQVGFPQETLDHNFEYEGGNAGGGLTVIQKEVDTSNIITRMLSAGSTKNIPYQYFRELSASELAAGNVQDPNVAPIFSNGYYNLMPKCFREYISGYNEQSFGIGTSAWIKGRADFNAGVYNPITYYEKNINTWGEREGIVEVNEDIFPTISGIDTRDEVVDVEQVLANEKKFDTSITRHSIDYTTAGDKFGQTIEIGEVTITNADEEEFNYYGIINVLSGYSGTNSATISIKYQLEDLSWQEEYSKTFSYNASSSDKRIYDNVKLTRNTTYKIYIIINGHTESIIISQFNSGYRFYQSLKSKYNQSNIINGYFQNSGNIFNPIILNTDYANSYTIHAITNEVSYIYGTFRTDIRMCSCDFKLVLQVDYGNGNFIDAPAYIDDEGIVYESYRLYTKTPNDLSSNTTYNFEDNYTFYLDGNYSYRLVTRIISFTPNYKYNGNLLRTFYNQKSFIYNTTHSSSISLLHNIHAEAYLAWGQGYYNIEFTVAKALIDNAITLGIFLAAELTTLIKGFESYLVEFNMDNLFTQKIGRPYKPYFSIWIKDIGFNINDYKSSQPAQLNFTTGALAGEDYLFEILDVTPDTSRTSSAYRLKCLKSKADVDATGLAIPNTFKQGQAGDKFILLNINMPYTPYVLNAEERLETYVKAELDKVCDAKRAFSIEIYDPFISSFAETNKLITGNYIKIKHTNLIGSGSTATVQIKGITITQSKGDMFPKFAIILSEESSITRPTITRRGGIIGDLYRRYSDLGDSLGNVTRNVSSINTNLGRTINVDTFNNNYIQVRGVNKEINALALSAKTTAEGKNKCWAVKPIPPYYKGDQWLVATGDVVAGVFLAGDTVYCKTTRLNGVFTNSDWGLSRYKGITEINTSINNFSTNVIGAIPSGKTVFGEINTVKSDLSDVSLIATSTKDEVLKMVDDNILSRAKKSAVRGEWEVYHSEMNEINIQASAFGIGEEKDDYNDTFGLLSKYLNAGEEWLGDVPSWISDEGLEKDTGIEGGEYRLKWQEFLIARTTLLNAMPQKVKALAEDKNKSWTTTPTTPYYKGDQWLSDSGEISTCIRTKLSGAFNGDDWRMPRYIGSSELIEKIGYLPLDDEYKERTVADLIGNVPKDKTLYTQIEAISLIANEAYRMSRPKDFINVSGIQDESNKTFNTASPFVLGSSRIYIAKDTFYRGVHYNELDKTTFEFISYAPYEEDFIMFEAIIDN